MERLQQIIERDQWAELLTSTQDLYKQSVDSEIEVIAFSEKEAIKKASSVFDVPEKFLNSRLSQEGYSTFFGIIKYPSHYLFSIQEEFKQFYSASVNYNQYNDLAQNKDGSFKLQMRKKGLILKIFQPEGVGKAVTEDDIIRELTIKGYHMVTQKLIQKALHTFQETVISPYIESPTDDSVFTITVDKNDMFAKMILSSPTNKGRLPEVSEIIIGLKAYSIVYGIKEEYIEEAINNNIFHVPVTIAEGTIPVKGQDTHIEYNFATGDDTLKAAVRPDGSVDFKELNLIQNVFKDSVLAVIHPATKGIEGTTIKGVKISTTDGNTVEWSLGSNVYISSDKTQVLATCAGQVYLKGKQICVDPALEIPSDVDLSIGNIDFLGNVIIKGGISDGFSVISGGNIEVHGHIGKCFIHAEGNIIAHQGIQGKDETQVECKGDLYANFIERSNINVGGNLIITKALLHSNVICDQGIYLIGNKRAIIAGGDIKAQHEIYASQIGAESYIETHVEVGYSKKTLKENATIMKIIETQKGQKTELEGQLSFVSDDPRKYESIKKSITSINNQIQRNEQTLEKNKILLRNLQKQVTITAGKSFMPGVKMKIGATVLDINAEHSSGTLYKTDTDQITIKPYSPSQKMQELTVNVNPKTNSKNSKTNR